jgi:hypothetical protein
LLAYIILLDASTTPNLNMRDGDTLLKVAASQFRRKSKNMWTRLQRYIYKKSERSENPANGKAHR